MLIATSPKMFADSGIGRFKNCAVDKFVETERMDDIVEFYH